MDRRVRVRVYKNYCDQAYSIWEQGENWSLTPWGGDTQYYHGGVSAEAVVILPEGFRLGTMCGGFVPGIFTSDGILCELGTGRNGNPVLLAPGGGARGIPLEAASNEN